MGRRSILGLTMVVTLVAAGCSAEASPAESVTMRAAWVASGITDYSMTYTVTCGLNGINLPEAVSVEVFGDQVRVVSEKVPREVATVDRLFGIVTEAEEGGADRVTVEYGEFGQPLHVDIDWYENAIDNEFCADVYLLEKLPQVDARSSNVDDRLIDGPFSYPSLPDVVAGLAVLVDVDQIGPRASREMSGGIKPPRIGRREPDRAQPDGRLRRAI
jgi:hypothetical protein